MERPPGIYASSLSRRDLARRRHLRLCQGRECDVDHPFGAVEAAFLGACDGGGSASPEVSPFTQCSPRLRDQ